MSQRKQASIPIHRRIGVRVGVLVALIVLAADLLSLPIWMEYAEWLHPTWFEPETLRAAAQLYEETGEFNWLTAEDRNYVILESVAFAVILAGLSALLVSWLATRRLRRLTNQVREPVEEGALPGPFEATKRDEITVLAEAMNAMRARAQGLLDLLEDRDVRRREWIAQVSHDLRTPITALSVSLERLQELSRAGRLNAPEVEELLQAARIDSERVLTMTEDLLEIGRLEIGDKLVLEPIPAGELVHQTQTALLPIAQGGKKELRTHIPGDLPTFQGDGRRLSRALENLVINSLQHAHQRVQFEVVHEDGWLKYIVKDDGPGFPSDAEAISIRQLTELRSRPDSAGLGLQVASRVAQAHEGTLGARNHPDGGAEVWLQLPLQSET